jgi:hypothetical protein
LAVTVDQANIYAGAGSNQTNHAFNTTAAVASGAMVVVLAFRWRSGGGGTYTVSGGGLTWTTVHAVVSGNLTISLMAAFAPSGLASGTTLTVNGSVGGNDYTVCAASYLGVDTSGTVSAAVRAFGGAAASTAAWSTGTITGNAGDAYIGGAGGDGTLRTSAPGGDATERIDFNSATSSGSITLVDDLAGEASDTLAGTWSGTIAHIAIGAAFIPAAGGTPVSQTFSAPYDAPQRLAAAPVAVWEAQQSLAAAQLAPWDALQGVQASAGAPYDALQGIAAGTAAPWEGIGGLAGPFTSPFEAAGQVVAALAGQWESLAAIAQTVGSPWDAPAGLAQVIVAPFEALAGIGSIAVGPWEAEAPPGLVVAAFALPYENTGAAAGQHAGAWESLSAFNVAFAGSWESLLALANVTGLPVETLAAAAAAFTGPYEARGLVAAALGLPWESIVPGVAAIYPPGHVGYVGGAVAGRVQGVPPAGHVAGSGAGHISN